MQAELINTLRLVANNKAGLEGILNTFEGVQKLVLCLDFAQIPGFIENVEWAKSLLRILTLLCFINPPTSHKYVTFFQNLTLLGLSWML
jgi:hypothetical protein